MSSPPGGPSYRLPNGDQYVWWGEEGRWVSPASGLRITTEQLQQLRPQRIDARESLASRSSSRQSVGPGSLLGSSPPASLSASYTSASSLNYSYTSPRNAQLNDPSTYSSSTASSRRPSASTSAQKRALPVASGIAPVETPRSSGQPAIRAGSNDPLTRSGRDERPQVSFKSTGPSLPREGIVVAGGPPAETSRQKMQPTAPSRAVDTLEPRTPAVSSIPARSDSQGRMVTAPGGRGASWLSYSIIDAMSGTRCTVGIGDTLSITAKALQEKDIFAHKWLMQSHAGSGAAGDQRDWSGGAGAGGDRNAGGGRGGNGSTGPGRRGDPTGQQGGGGNTGVPRYQATQTPERDFRVGTIIELLWTEPLPNGGTVITPSPGDIGRTRVRRFVVVETVSGYSAAIPIRTYQGQPLGAAGERRSDHGIIYTGPSPSPLLPGEEPGRDSSGDNLQRPVRAIGAQRYYRLDPRSRLNYAVTYQIDHRGCNIHVWGHIDPNDMATFHVNFRAIQLVRRQQHGSNPSSTQSARPSQYQSVYTPTSSGPSQSSRSFDGQSLSPEPSSGGEAARQGAQSRDRDLALQLESLRLTVDLSALTREQQVLLAQTSPQTRIQYLERLRYRQRVMEQEAADSDDGDEEEEDDDEEE